MNKPEIVCLCGSTKFKKTFERINAQLTLEGKIVLSVGVFVHDLNTPITNETKHALDELHKRKIDLADTIFVLNVNGYIGESTRSEIEYAMYKGKTIKYLEKLTITPEDLPDIKLSKENIVEWKVKLDDLSKRIWASDFVDTLTDDEFLEYYEGMTPYEAIVEDASASL